MLTVILLVQAVAGPPTPTELRPFRVLPPCPSPEDGGEIVVCGRKGSDQRLEKLPERYADHADRPLSFMLPGGANGNVHAFQNNLPGATSQGVAVSITLPFGRKKAK
jgi:hypothetical protein